MAASVTKRPRTIPRLVAPTLLDADPMVTSRLLSQTAAAVQQQGARLTNSIVVTVDLVVGTNRIDISAVHDARTGNFVLTSAEDNLVKGASGQAVQIMNLWCGFDETTGLV